MCEPCTADALLEAVRGLRVADPDLGFKPLLAKLREQQPDLEAGTKEVCEALVKVLKAESEIKAAAAAATLPAANEGGAPPNAPSHAALSLACFGCSRLPSDMDDDREKHPVCPKCVKLKVPTTYWCCVECPGNPGAWKLHSAYHKELKKRQKEREDGGVIQQRDREVAEETARHATQMGDEYDAVLAEGILYHSKQDYRRAGKTYREAIALRPDKPLAYLNLGGVLYNSGHKVEAAQRFLEAKERAPVGSEVWADATANAFSVLKLKVCDEVAKPEWWNDEGLKVLSASVVRAAPNEERTTSMRAIVLSGLSFDSWEAGSRSAADLKEAAAHFDRSAALTSAPAVRAEKARVADWCRSAAEQGVDGLEM